MNMTQVIIFSLLLLSFLLYLDLLRRINKLRQWLKITYDLVYEKKEQETYTL